MQELKSFEDLNEKSIEIILNFKPQEKYDKESIKEIQKLKENIKKAIFLLPDQEKKVLELRYFQNLLAGEIAQKLGKEKEEITKILLNGINIVKEKIKSDELVTPKVEKIIELKQAKPRIQEKPPVSINVSTKERKSILPGLIGIVVFVAFSLTTFYFVQKASIGDKVKNIPVSSSKNIKIAGSTSLLALSRRWENTFSVEYPKYYISITSSDSDKGIRDLIKGEIDIASSSRPISFLDQQKASQKSKELLEHRVAIDALVIIVNKKNPIEEINMDDLEGIFSGKIKNWLSLGALVQPVISVIRERGSGTNDFVIHRILRGDNFSSTAIRKKSNQEIFEFISTQEGAIGFVNSTNYNWDNKNIKYLLVKNYPTSVSVSPFVGKKLNEYAMKYGDYPLAHYLYLITLVDMPKNVQEFIDWVLTTKGQKVVEYSGLVPVISDSG